MQRFETLEEGHATGSVKETYLEIERLFGAPYVPALFRCLALHPDVLHTFWTKLKPNLQTQAFSDFSTQLRTRADALAEATFEFSNLYIWLRDHRFSREDIRHILYLIETLHYVNPRFLLATAALAAPAMGIKDSRIVRSKALPIKSQEPEFPTKISRVMFEQAPHDVKEDYFDIVAVMGSPLVPDEFTMFGHWPLFLKRVWSELKPVMRSTTFLDEAQNVSAYAIELAQELPYEIDLEDPGVEIRMILETFLSLNARLMVGMAAIRRMIVEGERLARAVGRAAGSNQF
jgi:hypothetical protein